MQGTINFREKNWIDDTDTNDGTENKIKTVNSLFLYSFYYINQPVDTPKLSCMVNKVYTNFNV